VPEIPSAQINLAAARTTTVVESVQPIWVVPGAQNRENVWMQSTTCMEMRRSVAQKKYVMVVQDGARLEQGIRCVLEELQVALTTEIADHALQTKVVPGVLPPSFAWMPIQVCILITLQSATPMIAASMVAYVGLTTTLTTHIVQMATLNVQTITTVGTVPKMKVVLGVPIPGNV